MAIDVCVVLAPIFSLLTYKCDITLEDFAICGSCKCLEHELCHILVFHTLGYNSAGRPITEVPPIKTWSRGHFWGTGDTKLSILHDCHIYTSPIIIPLTKPQYYVYTQHTKIANATNSWVWFTITHTRLSRSIVPYTATHIPSTHGTWLNKQQTSMPAN